MALAPLWELAIARHVEGREPMASRTPAARRGADDRLRVPLKDDHEVDAAAAVDEDLGQLDAPALMGLGRGRFALLRGPLGFESPLGGLRGCALASIATDASW